MTDSLPDYITMIEDACDRVRIQDRRVEIPDALQPKFDAIDRDMLLTAIGIDGVDRLIYARIATRMNVNRTTDGKVHVDDMGLTSDDQEWLRGFSARIVKQVEDALDKMGT